MVYKTELELSSHGLEKTHQTNNSLTIHPHKMSVKTVCGAFQLSLLSAPELDKYVETLKKYSVTELDTARIYPGSEECLGNNDLPKSFVIDTKALGFTPNSLRRDSIIESIDESFRLLKVDSVDIFYLHCPDPASPLEETLDTIGYLYKQGKFKRFGISNYSPEDVQKIYDYCKAKGHVLPSVFQGNYNAFARRVEQTLFPLLKELNVSFYAYSPIAGGFLAKTPQQVTEGVGRFKQNGPVGDLYNGLYNRPSLMKGLEKWNKIAEKAGITNAALAYRWVAHNSPLKAESGDAIILGARSAESMAQNLEAIKQGALDPQIAKEIDEIWETIKDDAPLDNYDYYTPK
ncbi:LAME_0E09472g1_1 [Lachancea meyersii CBS 8951]|uniref:LAME_0E09472g1_1 n=1 Tax=Lachancea meyersii CBS 8951 TaxID=1266667 RepID=A0A1G4JK65_9SACH|nr:LAME_0E09472g1_1 [Lachancea meyersii CBS 8951]